MNNTITGMKNTLEGINGRITGRKISKWAGRQSGRNYCHRIRKRKKNGKKLGWSQRPPRQN